MTSLNPRAFACSAFAWLVVLDMACFAPRARANCVTALPIDPPIAAANTVLPARKPARVSATCAVRYATGTPDPLTVGSIFKSAVGAEEHHARSGGKVGSASRFHHARSFIAQH